MAEDAPATEEKAITFNVKSSSDARYTLTLPSSTTVLDLKSKLSEKDYADLPADRQRLIYSGRVLKDPETLASYKIQDGHTVHMVRSAVSNTRQNPANAGISATNSPGTGVAAGTAGVPSNMAAGTANDPLAGLTGARYAGLAQLPGAGLFGPDGGVSFSDRGMRDPSLMIVEDGCSSQQRTDGQHALESSVPVDNQRSPPEPPGDRHDDPTGSDVTECPGCPGRDAVA